MLSSQSWGDNITISKLTALLQAGCEQQSKPHERPNAEIVILFPAGSRKCEVSACHVRVTKSLLYQPQWYT